MLEERKKRPREKEPKAGQELVFVFLKKGSVSNLIGELWEKVEPHYYRAEQEHYSYLPYVRRPRDLTRSCMVISDFSIRILAELEMQSCRQI